MTFSLNRNYGCMECSFDKLRNWALKNKITSELDGPEEIANRIIMLTVKMEERINYLQALVDARPNE